MGLKSVSVFRIFSGDKLVRNSLLNHLGVQPFRMLLARVIYKIIPFRKGKYIKEVDFIRENGMYQIQNFLPQEQFNALKEEVTNLWKRKDVKINIRDQGGCIMNVIDVKTLPQEELPQLIKYSKNDFLFSVISGVEKRKISFKNSAILLEKLVQGPQHLHDIEADMHSDIFFNTHKAWLYLNDVELKHGPLQYVPKSTVVNFNRLLREYKFSLDKTAKGSRRVSDDELSSRKLHPETLTCKANTLVFGKVNGYHRRIRGLEGNERYAVCVSVRFNPFIY